MNLGRILTGAFLALCIVLAWVSWMHRFELQVVGNQDGYAVAYRLDRWTGEVRLIDNDQWYPVLEANPDDLRQSLFAPKASAFKAAR